MEPDESGTYLITCPAHPDGRPSLALKDVHGGAVIHCHGGCTAQDVLAAFGITLPLTG